MVNVKKERGTNMKWNHTKSISVKLPILVIVFYFVLSVGYEIQWYHSVWIALVVGLVAYILGDYIILRKSGNIVATIADLGLTFLLTWFFVGTVRDEFGGDTIWMSFYVALIVAVVEYFYHIWLLKSFSRKHETIKNRSYRT